MKSEEKCNGGYLQIALTALCAAGLFCVLYLIRSFYPFGDGSIVITDLYSQYVPLLYRFYDVVTGQKNLFLDFSVSGGANLYVDTINEVLNPFNYVLLLFGRDRLYQAVNVVLLLYVAAAAASACFFLLKVFPKSRKWNVVLSLCYAFSGYMAYNYQIIKWMYFPVLFPLFCLALRRLIRDKKGGWYAVLLGYQLVLSIQLGFMTLLFVLFSGGIYFYTCGRPDRRTDNLRDGRAGKGFVDRADSCREEEKADMRAAMCRLGLYTIVGLLLSCAVLLPNIQILLASSRAGENLSYFGVMKQHGLDDLFERLFQIAQPVLLALFVRAFAGWRRRKYRFAGLPREGRFWLLLNAFLWLTVLLQPANLLWHMGSYVCFPVRYAYMVLFSGVCLTRWLLADVEEADHRVGARTDAAGERRCGADEEAARGADGEGAALTEHAAGIESAAMARFAVPCALALCIAACALTYAWEDRIVQAFSSLVISLVCPKETLVVCLILLLFFAAGLCGLAGDKSGKAALCAAALCGICLNLFIFLPPDYSVRLSNEAAYRKMTLQAADAAGELEKLEKTEAPEASGALGVPEISEETDTNRSGNNVLQRVKDDPELPLNAALVNRKNSLTGYFPTASQSFKNAMESLGYLVPWVATQSVGGTAVSDELLSMALLLDQEASELALDSGSVLGRQEELAEFVGGERCFVRISGEDLKIGEDGGAFIDAEGEQLLYLDPARTADGFRIFVNGAELEVPEPTAAYSAHRIVELGSFADETVAPLVTDKGGNVLPMDGMEIGMLDLQSWKAASERMRQLGEEEMEIDVSGGKILISLADAKAGQTVFLPFAALQGWSCTINGERADVSAVFGGFLGISVQEGAQEIVLQFIPCGIRIGAALTGIGAILLLLGALFARRRAQRQQREKVMSALYWILFAGGLLAVYVIPAIGLVCCMAAKVLRAF